MPGKSLKLPLHLIILIWFGLLSCWTVAETLVVGMSADYEPLVFLKEGKLAGIEPDNAAEVASSLGMKLRLVELPFAQLLPALEAGKVDVLMSGLSITEQRKTKVDFVKPFMDIGQMAIIRSSDIARFGYPRAIYGPGVKVGVEPQTTGAKFVSESMPEAIVLDYVRPEEAFAALRARKIDVYIHDAPTSWGLANSGADDDLFSLYRLLTREQLAWAVAKNNKGLLNKLEKARDELEQSGKLTAIQDFWIPVKVEVN